MIMQFVYRRKSVSKNSSMSQRKGLSQQPVFAYTRPMSARDRPSIQSKGPITIDICARKEYKNGLLKIGFKNISAVDFAATELIKFAKDENDQCREKLIHEFRNYCYEAMSAYDKYSNMDEGANPIPAEKRRKIESPISKVGWSLKESEGTYYIGESGGWFEKRFASILTEPYRQYFNNRTKEIKEGFSEDAGLLISWEQLRKRIDRWEQFLKSYPNFEETSEVQAYLNRYIGTFLSGMDKFITAVRSISMPGVQPHQSKK